MAIQLGVTGFNKTRVVYLLDLFEERGEREQYDLVCGAPLGDWVNAADVFFTCCECGFNSLGSWSYSKELMWNLGRKSMLHCFSKVKYQLGDTSGN